MFKFYATLLNIAFDCVFAIVLVNNLVIFVWRIIWDTQDLYLQDNIYLNSLISLFISYILLFIVKYMQINEINAKFHRSIANSTNNKNLKSTGDNQKTQTKSKTSKKFNLKFFILIFSIANINHWRAVWNFTTKLTKSNESVISTITIGTISILSLIGMKRVCALMSVPFQINKDCYQNAYQIQPTSVHHNYYLSLHNKNSNKIAPSTWQIVLSFIFEYLADFFTIQAWRSLWFIMDFYLFYGESVMSGLASLSIGSVIYVIILIVNKPLNRFVSNSDTTKKRTRSNKINLAEANDNKLNLITSLNVTSLNESKMSTVIWMSTDIKEAKNESKLIKKILLNSSFYMVFIGTVSIWRGIWMLQLDFCYPLIYDSLILNQNVLNLIYFVISIMILWFLNLTSALLSRSSCEDSYFESKKNYVSKSNHFNAYFSTKKVICYL